MSTMGLRARARANDASARLLPSDPRGARNWEQKSSSVTNWSSCSCTKFTPDNIMFLVISAPSPFSPEISMLAVRNLELFMFSLACYFSILRICRHKGIGKTSNRTVFATPSPKVEFVYRIAHFRLRLIPHQSRRFPCPHPFSFLMQNFNMLL